MNSLSSDSIPEERPVRSRRRRARWSIRLTPLGVLVLFACNLVFLGVLSWPILQSRPGLDGFVARIAGATQTGTPTLEPSPQDSPTATASPSETVTPTPLNMTPTQEASPTASRQQGVIILSMMEGSHSHLFAYQPLEGAGKTPMILTRLTSGAWDDRDPAVSPDGRQVVFSSNRNGYWELYLLDLATGLITDRLTDRLDYDGAPSWSPDGLWIVYESYIDENLEIFILPVNDEIDQPPIRLTTHSAADHSPVWSPQGRQIAFVSTRSGEPEIWLANLDQADETSFVNVSQQPHGLDRYPAWSPDGSSLVWASVQDGVHNLLAWDARRPDEAARYLGSGDWPVWSPDGQFVLTALYSPARHYLTAYPISGPGLVFPPLAMPGWITGLDWSDVSLPSLAQGPFQQVSEITPTPLWLPVLTPGAEGPEQRRYLVELEGIQAPFPFLQDLVDESFQGLRQDLASKVGWDFLSSLESAYVPLTAPLDPGLGNDWLYTGRAFAFNAAPLNAGWIALVREEFGAQTYWRVFLRTRYQDGSAGIPLKEQPWDLNARFQGDPLAYEMGGKLQEAIPGGYWFDFTQLANAYAWTRLPALTAWRAAYPATRFNKFAFTSDLEWSTAMLEIYPPEALLTPTVIVPPTRTLTPTSRWFQTPTPTLTPTPRPTLTPVEPIATISPTSPQDSAGADN
jgi:TolB protein